MDIKKRINIEHILLHATFQMIAAVVYGFGIYFLTARGYSSGEAGLCLSFASLINLTISPFLSNFLDHSKKITAFEVTIFTLLIVAALFGINYFCHSKSILLSIVTILAFGLYATIEPSVNVISSKFSSNNVNIEFAAARGIGSLSYGVICALFGVLTTTYSYPFIVVGGVGFCAAMLLTLVLLRKDFYKVKVNDDTKKIENISFIDFFKNNKTFILMCVCLTIIFTAYCGIDNFTLLECENVGGTSSDMGKILAFKASLEFCSMLLFPKLIKRFKLNNLIIFACFGFSVKICATWLAPSVLFIYLAQIFQGFSFGIIFPSIVEYVYQNMSEKEAVRGNALFTMTIGLGSLLSGTVGGYICELASVSTFEFVSFIVALIGAIGMAIVLLTNKHENK